MPGTLPVQQTLPTLQLLLLALLQGLGLLALHQAVQLNYWPANSPTWLLALYSLALCGPLTLLLTLEQGNRHIALRWLIPFNLLLATLAFYTGAQVLSTAEAELQQVLPLFIFTALIAGFKVLMYVQNFSHGHRLSYHLLFRYSWRNALSLALALVFTLCVWAALMLWAQLFKVIGITLFADIFTQSWFYYPILSLAFGLGVIIFRSQIQIIDTLSRILQALCKFLLIMLIVVSLLFLAALPFTGLDLLWDTGRGSVLILAMQGLILFLLNAVYQDEPDSRPYPLWLHRFIYFGVALLPVYSLIVSYGLYLRVEQYGWTISRALGCLIWLLFSLFSMGYLSGIARLRDRWLEQLSWVNVRMGWLVLALMLMLNSPLLDLRKISVNSQLARIEQGTLSLQEADFRYFRYWLAEPGFIALQDLKQRYPDNGELQLKIDNLYLPPQEQQAMSQAQFIAKLQMPNDHSVPDELLAAAYQYASTDSWQLNRLKQGWLLALDLDQDSNSDYVLVQLFNHSHNITLFYQQQGQWQHSAMSTSVLGAEREQALIDNLSQTPVVTPPRWQNLQIGELKLSVQP